MAESIFGNLIAGEQLVIQNEAGNFVVDSAGMRYEATSEKSNIYLSPERGFGLQTLDENGEFVDRITLDMDGNVYLDGSLTSVKRVGGWDNLEELGLQRATTAYFSRLGGDAYAFSAGTVNNGSEAAKFSVTYDGKLKATDADITGKITATSAVFNNATITGTLNGAGATWTGGTFNNIICNVLTANSGTFRGSLSGATGTFSGSLNAVGGTFTGTLQAVTGSFTELYASGGSTYVEISQDHIQCGPVIIDGSGLEIEGPTNSVRFWMNPPTASGGSEARWVDQGGYCSLGIYTSRRVDKKDITDISDEVSEIIDSLHPVYFRFKQDVDDSVRSVGFIAEEVDKVCKEITSYRNGSPSGVQYSNISALIIGELQRLRKRVSALESK